jgi:hypothetical protein
MKRYTTKGLRRNTLRLVGIGEEKSGSVSSPFGPVRAGLTTMQRTQDHQLSALLSSLEKGIEELNSKSYGVLSTYLSGMIPRARRTNSIYETIITDTL